MPRRYWTELDGMRAFAVLAVFAFHVGGPSQAGGRLGVDVFFVLSGFLITSILLDERAQTGRIAARAFYARRFRRLLPALLVTTVATGVVYALFVDGTMGRATTGPGLVGALTYSTAWIAATGRSAGGLTHTWSLSVEEHFYLVWPFVLVGLATMRRPWVGVTAVFLVAAAWRIAGWQLGWDEIGVYYRPDMRAHELLVGCLAAVLVAHLGPAVWRWGALAGTAVVAATMAAFPALLDRAPDGGPAPVAFAVGVAFIIGHLVTDPVRPLGAVLASPILVWIGQRSYGIYLIHIPIVQALLSRGDRWSSGPWMIGTTAIATLILAELSYRYVEQPFLRRPPLHPMAPSDGGPAKVIGSRESLPPQ